MRRRHEAHNSQAGFTLLEMLISILVMSIVLGALFLQIHDGQKSSSSEQNKLDLFQEARQFMDQMTRDLRAAGYPNTRNYTTSQSPAQASNAVGLVKVDVGDLWFESSVDGSHNVQVIRYHLVQDGPGCPCLMRSQTSKVAGDPVTAQTESDQTQLQNVMNGTSTDPIFTAFMSDGTQATLPLNMNDTGYGATAIANINSIAVRVNVQSSVPDLRTGQRPVTSLFSTVRLNNCSNSYATTANSVMGCTGN